MARITDIEARTLALPLDRPTAMARREVVQREYVLVRARDEGGNQGIGFCYAGNFGGTLVAQAVRTLIAPVVVGNDSQRIRGLWDAVYDEIILHGRAGSITRAHSAVDIALWDLNARSVGLPLWQYLGGATLEDSVPAYASGGYYLAGKSPDDLADEMLGYLDLGFDAVKMKVGRVGVTPQEDAERLAAVRSAVGDDVKIMLDANNAWNDVPSALAALRLLAPYNPYWIEEPFGPDDILSHARLAKETPITVATGEIEQGRWRHRDLLEKNAAQILQTDAAVCGGVTEYQRIANMAAAFGVSMCPHWFHDLHIHLIGSISNGQYVEYFPNDQVLNFRRVVSNQLEVVPGGRLKLPTGAGLGFDFEADVVEANALDEWA